MLPQHMSFLIHKIARLEASSCVTFNKPGIISVRHKADILAVMLARIDQSLFFRHFPDLRLRHAAQGEQRMCKLLLRQAVEHITLVFLFIDGFFQEELSVLFFDSGMAILNALPAGEWQYSCLGGVPAMMGNLRYGTSVIGVGTDESACVAVLARPDNPVFKTKGLNPKHPGVFGSPEDVRGKTILCTTVSSAHFALTAWLDAVGVKPTEVTIKNMDQPQALAAFENGIGDFVALWAPHMYAGTDKGWKVAGSAALCGKGTPLVLVADTKYADAHPEITAKFLSVYLRGVEHLRTTSVDDLIPEYQRFFFDWAGKTYSKELARLDLESHPAWDIKGQLALFDTSKGMSTVQQWQADTAQFFASIGSITPDELKKVENASYVTDKFLKLVK